MVCSEYILYLRNAGTFIDRMRMYAKNIGLEGEATWL